MRKPLTDKNGEVRELTAADIKHFWPIQETDPDMLKVVEHYRKCGRSPVESLKMRVDFRLAADVVQGIRVTGRGFNARVEKVLRDALANGKL